jgi:hypothetical protein
MRLAPPPVRPISIVVGDAARDELDPDAPYIRALELFCARAGVNVLSLSARGVVGIGDAVAIHRPNLVVVAGSHLDDDSVARWAYAIRLAAGAMPVAVYRRGGTRVRMRTTGTRILPGGAREAQRRIVDMIEAERRPMTVTGQSGQPGQSGQSGQSGQGQSGQSGQSSGASRSASM